MISASERQAALGKQPHRHGGRVPAARREAAEDRVRPGCLFEMKGLRIEFPGKSLDLLRIDAIPPAGEALADMQIVQEIADLAIDRRFECCFHRCHP